MASGRTTFDRLDSLVGAQSAASSFGSRRLRSGARHTTRDSARVRPGAAGVDAASWSPCDERHAEYFLELAEESESGLSGAAVGAWIERLQIEHDNLRAALEWTLSHPTGAADESALRLAGALGRFWWMAGYFGEGSRWLTRALAAG